MTKNAIEINNLHFAYRRKPVLQGLTLNVPQGSIFGFLGRNGAGKTTTIKILLGLLKPQKGQCRVLNFDTQTQTLDLRRNVGYMAEDQQMYPWMRIEQIIKWTASFYPNWDNALTQSLLDMLELPPKAKVKTLSKGQNSRLALLLSLGHQPQLVILDDPTLGLDPIARKDFLRHVIDLLQSNNITVFFSSHLLYEIEPVADAVAILNNHAICKTAPTDHLRQTVRKFIFTPTKTVNTNHLPGILDLSHLGHTTAVTIEDCDDSKRAAINQLADSPPQELALNLDEIFEAYVIGNRGRTPQSPITTKELTHA